MAVGRNGRIYVIWLWCTSPSADPTNKMPVLFSRLNDSHTAFEPQRNLMQYTRGGAAVSRSPPHPGPGLRLFWHAMGEQPGEDHRRGVSGTVHR